MVKVIRVYDSFRSQLRNRGLQWEGDKSLLAIDI